jgi:hypothetical protein
MAEISLTGATRVAGYVKKTVYNGNIEYRNFNPDLVGLQLTSEGGTPLFTMGNFNITTNLEPKTDKNFITKQFSEFITLEELNLSVSQTETLLENNTKVFLNLDKTKLSYYATFGSLTDFIRVSLENIIINWPASIYTSPIRVLTNGQELTGYTYENYVYNELTNTSTFKVSTDFIVNPYKINYLINGDISGTFNETNTLRNMVTDYLSYALSLNSLEYPVVNFTGSTNNYIHFEVENNPFSATSSTISFHIKPKNIICDKFFNSLDEFEYYLLNRQIFPIYTSTFKYPLRSDFGVLLYTEKSLTWPTTDGYNLDFDTFRYEEYATELFNLANDNDLINSNLMTRFLVSESITGFDTMPYYLSEEDQDTSGGKVNKLLNLYGVSYDELNRYIEGVQFANTVTYNKLDNTPDVYLKNIARIMGWDLIDSVVSNDLLSDYVSTSKSSFSGQSIGLTPVEADVELWRRIILNSPWLWKSKGTRKAIEFLLRFIGTPNGLITFNEYVYKVDKPIDMELFLTILELNGLDTDITNYPVDSEGYPRFFNDTDDLYFQSDGLWYRETSGANSVIDITSGNNPHIGPYDGGNRYFNQLRTLIQDFTPVTITSSTVTTTTQDLFTNYNTGQITDYDGDTYVDVQYLNGSQLSDCIVYTTEIIKDPKPEPIINECGCVCDGINDESLSICLKTNKIVEEVCDKNKNILKEAPYYVHIPDNNPNTIDPFFNKICCSSSQGDGFQMYADFYDDRTDTINSGYVCCIPNIKCACVVSSDWVISETPIEINGEYYLNFITLNGLGTNVVVGADNSLCPYNSYSIFNWTTPVNNIIDPYSGLVGVGCKLTQNGLANLPILVTAYKEKVKNELGCDFIYPIIKGEPIDIIAPIPVQSECVSPTLTSVEPRVDGAFIFSWVLNQQTTTCGSGIAYLEYSFDGINYSEFTYDTNRPLMTDLIGYTSASYIEEYLKYAEAFGTSIIYFRLRLAYVGGVVCDKKCEVTSNIITLGGAVPA